MTPRLPFDLVRQAYRPKDSDPVWVLARELQVGDMTPMPQGPGRIEHRQLLPHGRLRLVITTPNRQWSLITTMTSIWCVMNE